MTKMTCKQFYPFKDNFKIIDIRDVFKYDQGHIKGSINIPGNLLYDKYLLFLNKKYRYALISENISEGAVIAKFLNLKEYSVIYICDGIKKWPKKI